MGHKRVILDISIDPVAMEMGGDVLDQDRVFTTIRRAARATWPGATIKFKTLQVGYRQGHAWADCWINGVRDDDAGPALLHSIDWSDASLYRR